MIKKLYKKSEIWFALAWVIVYVVLASTGDNISENIGILKIATLPILIILSIILFLFVKNNGLAKKYGLCKSEIPASKMLFYIPLIIIMTTNLWYGVTINFSPLENVLYILSMLCVGFLEEMIFRGFLFNALVRDGVKSAIIISSVSFGIGHIVNLVNGSGAGLLPTMLQVVYAIAIGFAFVMIYYKTKSLLPCILTHSILNSLSVFANEEVITPQKQIISSILIALIAAGYALYIASAVKEKTQNN
ncbi:CPBP family intramembrane glutamic endopeptidase [Facklamia hominis]|uniref:CPBP family intramembrane glutamic endopeptidase n=1 Tax=Facklamia hominis TaxID=178214 RepID=UPI00288BD05A|nr:CPBP family intramembrane glutamic endopeptidase [Facklamia hominis]WPJ90587.1 CPBP family intramembrane glutamic endopeptidase [Facklamia hominis]